MTNLLKFFKWDFLVAAAALFVAFLYRGVDGLTVAAILWGLEMVFSFDNAGVNAKYLKKFSPFWRTMFLSVGIIIAVFGMRLLFPFLIVCLAGHIGPLDAWHLAMQRGDAHVPGTYGYILNSAHPAIAAFGSMFLLMLFLNFIFDTERDSFWLSWIERPLNRAGHFDSLSVLVAGLALLGAMEWFAPHNERLTVLLSGLIGILSYVLVNGFASFMENQQKATENRLEGMTTAVLVGKAALSLFLFLEVLDASFSFDGVLGAFAVTSDPIIIAIGLGIGALFVRSMTIYLVEHNALDEVEYLEHGAHWAICILALMLLVTIKYDIPDYAIGLVGLAVIAASIYTSLHGHHEEPDYTSDSLEHNEPAPGIYASHPDHN